MKFDLPAIKDVLFLWLRKNLYAPKFVAGATLLLLALFLGAMILRYVFFLDEGENPQRDVVRLQRESLERVIDIMEERASRLENARSSQYRNLFVEP